MHYFSYQIILLTRDAGQGKTNFLCDFTENYLLKKGIITLYYNAFEFCERPIDTILRDLTCNGKYTQQYVKNVLMERWKSSLQPIMIIIDGLNENTTLNNFGNYMEESMKELLKIPFVKIIMTSRNELLKERFGGLTCDVLGDSFYLLNMIDRSVKFEERIFKGYVIEIDDCEEIFEEAYGQDDYELETKARWMSVRTRNLVINLVKTLIRLGVPEKRLFTREELINTYKFKLSDFEQIVDNIFECSEEGFCLNADTNEFINKVIASHNAVQPYVPSAEARFLRIYGRFYDDFSQNFIGHSSYKKYHSMYESIKEIIPILHWGYLPIFGRYLLYNRESDPERDMLEFYDHIDCLNALLNEVKGEALQLDNNSDGSLNVDIEFNIYSRKQKTMEYGYIRRTIDGWYFKFSLLEGKSNKDAMGTLTTYLKQEKIFYPVEGISYAFKNLWDDVDDGEITYDEYVFRIGEIANWINKTDAVLDEQPEWLHYTCGQKYHINTEKRCEAGDSSLNRDISFVVFSRRWGHEDHYTIRRTQDGWYCGFIAINGECQKSGEGALWNNLNHDSIFFSQEGIRFAMLKLWDEANQGLLSYELLSERLQQVADWISITEKSVYEQPEWVYYY